MMKCGMVREDAYHGCVVRETRITVNAKCNPGQLPFIFC